MTVCGGTSVDRYRLLTVCGGRSVGRYRLLTVCGGGSEGRYRLLTVSGVPAGVEGERLDNARRYVTRGVQVHR